MLLNDPFRTDPFSTYIQSPSMQFLQLHAEEYWCFLLENPPKFTKNSWTCDKYKLSLCLKDEAHCIENSHSLRNNHLPLDLPGDALTYIEIHDPKQHITVSARIGGNSLRYVYTTVHSILDRQKFLDAGSLNIMDIIALNYYRRLGNPEEFLAEFRCVSEEASPNFVYEAILPDGVETREISISMLMGYPDKIGPVEESFSFSYDLEDLEEGETAPGSYTAISYKQFLKDGVPNPKPWRVSISNYTLVKRQLVRKENVITKTVNISDQDFLEMAQFIDAESARHIWYEAELREWAQLKEIIQKRSPKT